MPSQATVTNQSVLVTDRPASNQMGSCTKVFCIGGSRRDSLSDQYDYIQLAGHGMQTCKDPGTEQKCTVLGQKSCTETIPMQTSKYINRTT